MSRPWGNIKWCTGLLTTYNNPLNSRLQLRLSHFLQEYHNGGRPLCMLIFMNSYYTHYIHTLLLEVHTYLTCMLCKIIHQYVNMKICIYTLRARIQGHLYQHTWGHKRRWFYSEPNKIYLWSVYLQHYHNQSTVTDSLCW